MASTHGIGDVAARSGCTVQTIRYYERIGLVAPPVRTSGNQRVYDDDALARLTFIRHTRDLGFSLGAIRGLLDLSANSSQDCAEIDAIAKTHLEVVRQRISGLRVLETELARMVEACARGLLAEIRAKHL